MDLSRHFDNRNVLVTGGLGFIGSNLSHRLVELGARITLVDSMIPDAGGNLYNIRGIENKVNVNISDIRDRNSVPHLVRDKNYIFNLAGQVSHIDSMHNPYNDLEINARAQLTILEACRYHNPDVKMVYTSTRQVYGKTDYLPVDEKHILHPIDVNGVSTMAGEWFHTVYNNVYGIRCCSLRLTNTYGPRQLLRHNRQGFFPWFVRLILEGRELDIFGDGTQVRDFNYVDDVVDAMLLAAVSEQANGEVFNLGAERFYSLLELVELMIKIRGGSYKLTPFPAEAKKIDIGDYYGDYRKITRVLGWRPQVTIEEGLRKTFDYYDQNMQHYV
jgi:UDP-glucose 4-epimerase